VSKPLNVDDVAEVAEEVLERAKRLPSEERPSGAINWADLHVVEIEEITPVWPSPQRAYWRLTIEEASPNSGDLCTVVSEALFARFPEHEIEVVTEW